LRLGYNAFKDEGTIFIAESLYSKCYDSIEQSSVTIKSLDLSFNDITDIGAESIAKYLSISTFLQVLFLSGNNISSKGFASIADALNTNRSLTELDLTGNAGRNNGAIALAQSLDNNHILTSLSLSGCRIGIHGIRRLKQTLEINHTITCINLSNNNIGDDGAKEIAEALEKHKRLESLDISFNNITFVGTEYLGKSLTNYTSLKRLAIDNNKLRDKGSIHFCTIYLTMNLKDLNISFNEIGVDGIVPLLQTIASHMTLNVLSLSGNNIDYNAATILSNLLSSNKTLHTLHLYHTGLSEASQVRIAAGIASNREGLFTTLSGFDLAKSVHILGLLKSVEQRSNKVILKCFNETWKAKTLSEQKIQKSINNSNTNDFTRKVISTSDLLDCVDGLAEEFLKDDDVTELFTNLNTTHKAKAGQVQESVQELLLSCNESIENALKMISVDSFQDIAKCVGPADKLSPIDTKILFASILEASKEKLSEKFCKKELWELQQYYMSPKIDILKDEQNELLDEKIELVASEDNDNKNEKKLRRVSLSEKEEHPTYEAGTLDDGTVLNIPVFPSFVIHETERKGSYTIDEENEDEDQYARPRKRSQGPAKIRIAYYPRIKDLYDAQKLSGNEISMLGTLRYLKFLETLPPPYSFKNESSLEVVFFEGHEKLISIS